MFSKLKIRLAKKREMRARKRKITKNFKDLKERKKLSRAQKKEIQDFYKSLIGKKVQTYGHEYFYSYINVIFSPKPMILDSRLHTVTKICVISFSMTKM